MQTILLLIIGVFLIYRMMRVEERMNKIEHDMMKMNQKPNEDVFWESVEDKVENDSEYRDTDGWDEEMEKRYWAEQPPEPFATPEEVEKYNIDGKK
jgi:hypothetical protein